MAIKSGQIVLFNFPQTDLILGRLRPALLLAKTPSNQNDWLVCMISSRLHQEIPNVDNVIQTNDADFANTGLKSASLIRLTRLAVVEEKIFKGKIGEISDERLEKIKNCLADWIKKN